MLHFKLKVSRQAGGPTTWTCNSRTSSLQSVGTTAGGSGYRCEECKGTGDENCEGDTHDRRMNSWP